MDFEVWAPNATSVELVMTGRRRAMSSLPYGWWHTTADAGHGAAYAFSLDGSDPLPDPRSHHQPNGVHAPSAVVDHSLFEWTDDGWAGRPVAGQVLYEVHVGTFTPEGTFDGVVERLDHLVELGITAVELMPVAAFPGDRGWGYDGVCLYAPHEGYGGPDGLKRLVNAGHEAGLGVILDVVYNHLGPDGNYLARFGPYFARRYSTPWGEAINLDEAGSSEVRDFLIGNALHWLETYHLDGLRIDAIHALYDTSAIHFLEELSMRVDALEARLGRHLLLIAESDLNDPRVVTPREANGYGIDAQWSDDFHHALHAVLTGETLGYYGDFGAVSQIADSLRRAFVYDGLYSEFRERHHGRRPHGLSGHRFIGYLQNHDQTGNRAAGERVASLIGHDLLKVGAALVLTAPFVPLLFQGEEWGATSPFCYFTDHEEELGRSVFEGRRAEAAAFGWDPDDVSDPQAEDTFRASRLDWREAEKDSHRDLSVWHRELIALRKRTPELTDGRLDLVDARYDDDARWLVVERGPVSVACNFSGDPVGIPVAEDDDRTLLLSSTPVEVGGSPVELPPESVAIWRSES